MIDFRIRIRTLAAFAVLVGLSACDIPSEAPSFSLNPTIKTPLVFSDNLQFLGPGAAGEPAIIDTTSPDFDSLFTVNPGDQSIYIVREVDRIELDNDVSLFEPVSVGPTIIEASIGSFGSQSFTGSSNRLIGLQEGDATSAPPVPRAVDGGSVYFPGTIAMILTVPASDLVSFSSSAATAFGFSADTAPTNVLTVNLTNRAGTTLTDGSFAAATIPVLELVDDIDQVIASTPFDRAPAHNQSATASLTLANLVVPSGARLRLDVGTTSGMSPIVDDPGSLELAAALSPTRYSSFVFDHVAAQSDIVIDETFDLAGDEAFTGVVASGNITLSITNTLDIPFSIDALQLENTSAFGSYSVGHVFASTSGDAIPPSGSTTIVLPVLQEGLASTARVTATLSSPGNPNSTMVSAGDGLHIDIDANLDVDEVYVTPTGESYAYADGVDFDIPEIELRSASDFVELASGTLELIDIINEYGVGIATLQVGFPGILLPPYGPGDSLVVNVANIAPQSGPRTTSVNLAGARIHAPGEVLRYSVRAEAENSAQERFLTAAQRISGSVEGRDLVPVALSASIEPRSVAVTADANGDNMLDVLSDAEAEVVSIDGLDEFYDFGLDGLEVVGAELTLNITTDISADIELYGTLAGVRRTGEIVYLEGLSSNAVSPSDSLTGRFAAGGQPVLASQMVRMSISGSTPGKVVQRTIVFDDTNSNVDAFIANLPEQVRMVAQAVIGRTNDQVILSDPFVLAADVSLSLPLAFRGDFHVEHEVAADLSSLEQLTDPTTSVEIEVAELALDYSNAIPIGVDVTLRFLDASGVETIVLPAVDDPAVRFAPSPSDALGFATGATDGRVAFPLDEERLRALSNARTVVMDLSVDTGSDQIGRVRATDRVSFAMSGNFDILLHVGR